MKNKVFAFLLTVTLALGCATTVSAATPSFSIKIPSIPNITVQLPDSVKEAVKKAAQKWAQEHQSTEASLETPAVTKAAFYHKDTVYNSKGYLQIDWEETENAVSYEIEITNPDGAVKTYTSENISLIVYEGSDEFLLGCPKQWVDSTLTAASVKVRAIGEKDSVSEWSEETKIGCNVLHSR